MIKKLLISMLIGGLGYLIFVPPLLQSIQDNVSSPEASVLELFHPNQDQQDQSHSANGEL